MNTPLCKDCSSSSSSSRRRRRRGKRRSSTNSRSGSIGSAACRGYSCCTYHVHRHVHTYTYQQYRVITHNYPNNVDKAVSERFVFNSFLVSLIN